MIMNRKRQIRRMRATRNLLIHPNHGDDVGASPFRRNDVEVDQADAYSESKRHPVYIRTQRHYIPLRIRRTFETGRTAVSLDGSWAIVR